MSLEKETRDGIYVLKTSFASDNQGTVLGFYFLEKDVLKATSFNYIREDNQRKWFIDKPVNPIIIGQDKEILDEFFDKDLIYSEQKQSKHLYRFEKIPLAAGLYYPRIYRPILAYNHEAFFRNAQIEIEHLRDEVRGVRDFFPIDNKIVLTGVTQLSLLVENLKVVCRTIHPSGKNLGVYGNEIRNLLILSCTEIEAQLRGIYELNNSKRNDRPSTKEYFTLRDPLKLNHYQVQFNLYPWLGSFSPFLNWSTPKTTESLKWYDDYNAVKHDREKEFERGNLDNVLNAIVAFAILLKAQYGSKIPYWQELIGRFFIFTETPQWGLEEQYLPPFKGEPWKEKKLQV